MDELRGRSSAARIAVSLLGAMMMTGSACAELHIFSLPDGRSLEARIVSYDAKSGQVTLEREDGNRFKVSPSGFVESDQRYIKEWVTANAFLSDNTLKVDCEDKQIKEWKEEETTVLHYSSGDLIDDAYVHNVIEYEEIGYDFTFENKGASPISGLTLEYCIYYQQSRMIWEETPPVEVMTLYGTVDLPDLLSGKPVTISTKTVTIYDDEINPIAFYARSDQRRGGEGEVLGIHARLVMKQGDEVSMRDVAGSESISEEEYPWTETTSNNIRPPSVVWQ